MNELDFKNKKYNEREILKSMQYAKHMLIVDSSKLILQKNLE